MFVPLTPLDCRRRAARLFARKTGVIDGERRFTYGQFDDRCTRLANALHTVGACPGDTVAFLAYNSHPLLEAYFGVLEACCILLPLNIRLNPADITYILRDANARFLFADPDFAPVVARVLSDLDSPPPVVWLGEPPEGAVGELYETLLAGASREPAGMVVDDENAVAELFYTSGTTGRPKGVMLTHRNLYLHALYSLLAMRAETQDVQLHTIPLFHVNGWGTPQGLTMMGGTHVMLRKFDPGEALRLIEAEGVTRFYAVATMLNAMLNHPDARTRDLSSLTEITMGGAPVPPEMIRRGQEMFGCRVVSGYGLSETTPVLTYSGNAWELRDLSDEDRILRLASTGQPIPGVDLDIVDDEGMAMPWDGQSIGEIVARGNSIMAGYHEDEDLTATAMRDGWFHTGDMATVDEDGYFLIMDRKKDIIISGGENISSVEIEKVIYEHPAVLEVAVVGVPDEQWGEVPRAIVALKPGESAAEADIIDFCRERLSSFKLPRAVDFCEALPKGGTGKILKRDLREPYWAGMTRRVH